MGRGWKRTRSAPRQSLTRQLFFKWIKQHLRIKAFYGYSENAVTTQIWIAVSVYVLVAILKKRLALEASLHEILQVLSVTLFEQVPILQAFDDVEPQEKSPAISNQLNLWDLYPDASDVGHRPSANRQRSAGPLWESQAEYICRLSVRTHVGVPTDIRACMKPGPSPRFRWSIISAMRPLFPCGTEPVNEPGYIT